jgi:hypothetical protein
MLYGRRYFASLVEAGRRPSSNSALLGSLPVDEAVQSATNEYSSLHAEAFVQDRPLVARLAHSFPPEDALEAMALLEMRYRQHLALCQLQELFESGALQALEG